MNTEEYIGIPYKKGGRNPQEGFDCWGLVAYIYEKELGIKFKQQYNIVSGETLKITKAFKTAIDSNTWMKIVIPEQFCGVALSQNKKIHHVGIWVENGCLHAIKGVGVVYNSRISLELQGYNKLEFYKCMI